MTQPEDPTKLEFIDHAQTVRDLGGEPINLGRDTKGRAVVLDLFQEPVIITDTRAGKTQTYPEAAEGAR